ncbi:DUF485 domain-containing protein [Virgibacillus sediminis]|uniref:DUF485 domain-containing protein n=1 Tax=Virgibacillus sediminis TaxID=202260 RepID=A0ABV7A2F1_9BACI
MSIENDYIALKKGEKQDKFVRVAKSRKFKELTRDRKKFIVPLSTFFLLFYFSLPILTSYTNVLNRPVVGDISLAWFYAFSQFIMTWVLCTLYVRKSASFDRQAEEIIEEELDKGGRER